MSWKTTVFGLMAALGGAVMAALQSGLVDATTLPAWVKGVAGLVFVMGTAGVGFFARDNGVTSEQVAARSAQKASGSDGWGSVKSLWLLMVVVLVFASGCAMGGGASARKKVTTTATNGVVIVSEFTSWTRPWIAWGDARMAVDHMKVSNTDKTQSIGYSGLEMETTTTNLPAVIKSGGALIGEAASAYMKSQGL